MQGDARELTLDFWQEYAPTVSEVSVEQVAASSAEDRSPFHLIAVSLMPTVTLARGTPPFLTFSTQGMDVVLSDMCHFTHGNKMMDSYKSLELAQTAVDIAMSAGPGSNGILRPGGSLIMKLLQVRRV